MPDPETMPEQGKVSDASTSRLLLLKALGNDIPAVTRDDNSTGPSPLPYSCNAAIRGADWKLQGSLSDMNDQSRSHKHREQLQLLTAELRDRDNELNAMLASHQAQLAVWEGDRSKLTAFTAECASYRGELNDSKRQLKKLVGFIKLLKRDLASGAESAEGLRAKIEDMRLEVNRGHTHHQQLQGRNDELMNELNEKCSLIGRLEASEHELITMLRIKDDEIEGILAKHSEVVENSSQMEIKSRQMEQRLQKQEREVESYRTKYKEFSKNHEILKSELQLKTNENADMQLEVTNYRAYITELQQELALTGEREERLKEVVESQRSKQDRQAQELGSLRQLCERQQKDMSLLQKNVSPVDAHKHIRRNIPNISDQKQNLSQSKNETDNSNHTCNNSNKLSTSGNKLSTKIPVLQKDDVKTENTRKNVSADSLKSQTKSGKSLSNSTGEISVDFPSVNWEERRTVLENSCLKSSISTDWPVSCKRDSESPNDSNHLKNMSKNNVNVPEKDTADFKNLYEQCDVRNILKKGEDDLLKSQNFIEEFLKRQPIDDDLTSNFDTASASFNEMYENFVADLDIVSNGSSFVSGVHDLGDPNDLNDLDEGELNDLDVSDQAAVSLCSTQTATSPSSKLFRLLQESKAMVHNLEQSTVPHSQE